MHVSSIPTFPGLPKELTCTSLVSLGGLMGLAQSSCLGENGDGVWAGRCHSSSPWLSTE